MLPPPSPNPSIPRPNHLLPATSVIPNAGPPLGTPLPLLLLMLSSSPSLSLVSILSSSTFSSSLLAGLCSSSPANSGPSTPTLFARVKRFIDEMLLEDEPVSERWRLGLVVVEGRSIVATEGEAEAERDDEEPAYEMAGDSSEAEGEREWLLVVLPR